MRALIRGKEICLENAWTKWQRMNMLFLTGQEKDEDGNPVNRGDGWTLVEDYVPTEPVEGIEEPQPIQTTSIQEKPAEQPAEPLPETVSIGGKEYTLDELKKLIE